MQKMKIKPVRDIVKDPLTLRPLPHDRATVVPINSFWTRRLLKGDIVRVDDKPKQKAKKPDEGKEG